MAVREVMQTPLLTASLSPRRASTLNDADGTADGPADGAPDGIALGDADGVRVGAADGAADGTAVGSGGGGEGDGGGGVGGIRGGLAGGRRGGSEGGSKGGSRGSWDGGGVETNVTVGGTEGGGEAIPAPLMHAGACSCVSCWPRSNRRRSSINPTLLCVAGRKVVQSPCTSTSTDWPVCKATTSPPTIVSNIFVTVSS